MKESILFLGDLYYTYDFMVNDYQEIGNWIKQKGFAAVVNLEGSLNVEGARKIRKRGPNMAHGKGYMDALHAINTKGVCLANNHMMDFGAEGLKALKAALDSEQIPHCGAGENVEEACKPMYISASEKRIGILNFGWDIEEVIPAADLRAGCAPMDRKRILSAIKETRRLCDCVVVCLHWGFEYHRLPMPKDVAFAHEMIDCGADLIIGNHPHNIQPKETYKGKSIYYSLGNFYFSEDRKTFQKKFKEPIMNQCDYGLMVAVDFEDMSCQEYLVVYDPNKDVSVVNEKNVSSVLEDISGCPYKTKEYAAQVRRRKSNYTPVLTLDEAGNKRKLRMLFLYYELKRIAKRILIGEAKD